MALDALRTLGASRVLDLGCGEGRLIGELLKEPSFSSLTGFDVSHRALEAARQRLHLDTLSERQKERVTLLHDSLGYRDKRLSGYDAGVAMEVVNTSTPRGWTPSRRWCLAAPGRGQS